MARYRNSLNAWRGILVQCVLVGLLLITSSLSFAEEITIFEGRTMGPIPYQVRAVLPEGIDANEVAERIGSVLRDVNQQMSTYIPDSELSQFNASRDVDTWIEVSAPTAKVVAEALKFADQTEGAFDPTVGPLVNLWGFGPEKDRRKVPSDEQLAAAKARVGFAKVSVRLEPPALQKQAPNVALDLSAIAKGYAVDAVGDALRAMGCETYMVEIGGEVVARGRKPGGHPWNIGIEKPIKDDTYNAILELENAALATSGDYRNYYEAGGQRYSHTIDPSTGRPVEHNLATASVLAPTCMEADALATTMMVLGPERGLEFANKHNIATLLVSHQGTGFVLHKSAAWRRAFPGNDTPVETPIEKDKEKAMSVDYIWLVAIVAAVFALVILAMAIGAIFAGKRIRGSCGGIAGSKDAEGNLQCSLCSNPSTDCTRQDREAAQHASSYQD